MEIVLASYESRLALIKLPALKSPRIMLSGSFLLGLIQAGVFSDYLLCKINFNAPIRRSRSFNLLNLQQYHRSVHTNNNFFRQICLKFSNLYHLIDPSESNYSLNRKIIFIEI